MVWYARDAFLAHAPFGAPHLGGVFLQKRRIGLTDCWVSSIGLGTVKLGRNEGVKYPHRFTLPTDQDALNLLARAKELGVNLLDTAPAYGTSEERLGVLLGNQRKDWIIATKVGETFAEGVSQFDFSKAAVLASIERSLKRLKTDYLDFVLVHSSGEDEAIIQNDTIFETLQLAKAAGKVRYLGFSSKTIAGGLLALEKSDVLMVTYHPHYTDEKPVLSAAALQQKGIFIKKALASGHINTEDAVRNALQFVLKEPAVSSVILGTLNPAHLETAISAAK